jgi:hypothetical protein
MPSHTVLRSCFCGTSFKARVDRAGKFCSQKCAAAWKSRDTPDRFWGLVDQSRPEGCWPWTGNTVDAGYGVFTTRRSRTYAHRKAWELENGRPVGPGKVIAHRCDNPPCCRPGHLFETDDPGNRADCVAKRRHCFGSRSSKSLLTEETATKALRMLSTGATQSETGRRFGVSRSAISSLATGRNWKHLRLDTNTKPADLDNLPADRLP